MRIHFICRGNVLRSLIAETYLRSLQLPNITATSSGTNVDLDSKEERTFFANTIALFRVHGIEEYAKDTSHQLTQDRVDRQDLTICMNQRVIDEANQLVDLPEGTRNWDIVDIGEGHRTAIENTRQYEEEIFQEIKKMVDKLVAQLSAYLYS
jgi:protein-tyrosine-phosphatase